MSLMLLMAWLVHRGAPVAFLRAPAFLMDQEDVRLEVRVVPAAVNRTLTISASDGEFVMRSSAFELDGSEAPLMHRVHWRALPPGEYRLVAQAQSGRDTRPLIVVGEDGVR